MNKHLIAVGLAVLAFGALPTLAFANYVVAGGVKANCSAGTVTITVAHWAGDVRITEAGIEKAEKLPPSPNSSVTIKLTDIGGNGSYAITRENPGAETLASDGRATFTVDCVTPSPSPSPTSNPSPSPSSSPLPTPSSSHSPTPTPTGGTSPGSTVPTPSPVGQGGVLAASTTTPGLPVSGASPDDPNGGFMLALAVALVSVLAIAGLVKARR